VVDPNTSSTTYPLPTDTHPLPNNNNITKFTSMLHIIMQISTKATTVDIADCNNIKHSTVKITKLQKPQESLTAFYYIKIKNSLKNCGSVTPV